jgi:hypothetical protein
VVVGFRRLRTPPINTNPDPNRSIEAGSGTDGAPVRPLSEAIAVGLASQFFVPVNESFSPVPMAVMEIRARPFAEEGDWYTLKMLSVSLNGFAPPEPVIMSEDPASANPNARSFGIIFFINSLQNSCLISKGKPYPS